MACLKMVSISSRQSLRRLMRQLLLNRYINMNQINVSAFNYQGNTNDSVNGASIKPKKRKENTSKDGTKVCHIILFHHLSQFQMYY